MRIKHTPTPWKKGNLNNIFTDDSQLMIANLDVETCLNKQIREANSEFIVLAVNSHELLIEIAKQTLQALNSGGEFQMGELGRHNLLEEKVLKALKQVGEYIHV